MITDSCKHAEVSEHQMIVTTRAQPSTAMLERFSNISNSFHLVAVTLLHDGSDAGRLNGGSMKVKLLLLSCLQAIVAVIFLKGFLLTRVELPDVAQCLSSDCSSQLPTYSKAVVLIVDAVRYDFLCGKPPGRNHVSGSLMPKTLHWVQAAVSAAHAPDAPQ